MPRWALPRPVANVLALMTLGVLYFEYQLDDTQLIRSLGHWLVYLQLIKYFLPKTRRRLVPVPARADAGPDRRGRQPERPVSASGYSPGRCWRSGCSASSFSSARRAGSSSRAARPIRPTRASSEFDPYEGLFDVPYVVATARVLVTTLALGGLIFLTLPRQAGATRSQPGAPMTRHLTGFDEEVALGQFGEILENDSVVMTVDFTDADGKTSPRPSNRSGAG